MRWIDVDIENHGTAGGTGGMVTKIDAARIATSAGIPVVLTTADQAEAALAGGRVGTLFHPTGRRRPTRLLWLRHASDTRGTLVLDAGAVRAHPNAKRHCSRPASPRYAVSSPPARRSSWSVRMGWWSPRAGELAQMNAACSAALPGPRR